MKKVLIISYYYPPCIKSGSQRALRLGKYLPQFGIQPVILTATKPLCNRIDPDSAPDNLEIYRAKEFFPFKNNKTVFGKLFGKIWRTISLVDNHLFWVPFVYMKGIDIVRKHQIDVLFITGYPFSTFIAGYLLRKRTRVPYCIDYRDPWLSNPVFLRNKNLSLLRRIEKLCIKHASLVFAATTVILEDIFQNYPQCKSKVRTFTYSYDPVEFISRHHEEAKKSQKLFLLSVGSVYDDTLGDRFLQALSDLADENIIHESDFEFKNFGNLNLSNPIPVMLKHMVEIHSYIPRQQVFEKMKNCDGLILIHGSGETVAKCYPGRMFEYFAAEKPILYIGPAGIAAESVNQAGGMAITESNWP